MGEDRRQKYVAKPGFSFIFIAYLVTDAQQLTRL